MASVLTLKPSEKNGIRCISNFLVSKLETMPEGILQDVHWTSGFGYFPTYAMGNAMNIMYVKKMDKDIDVYQEVAEGHMDKILSYLRENVFASAPLKDTKEWIKDISWRRILCYPLCRISHQEVHEALSSQKKKPAQRRPLQKQKPRKESKNMQHFNTNFRYSRISKSNPSIKTTSSEAYNELDEELKKQRAVKKLSKPSKSTLT